MLRWRKGSEPVTISTTSLYAGIAATTSNKKNQQQRIIVFTLQLVPESSSRYLALIHYMKSRLQKYIELKVHVWVYNLCKGLICQSYGVHM